MTKSDLTLRVPRGRVPITHAQHDANFQRLNYFNGAWAAGTYEIYEIVYHRQNTWICLVPTTTQEPDLANVLASTSDWWPMSINPWGYGLMWKSAPDLAFPDLGAGWQTITYDSKDFEANTTLDTAAGSILFGFTGVWEVTVTLAFDCVEAQNGRVTNVRLFDGTTGSRPYPVAVGRNQEGSSATIPIWISVDDTTVGSGFVVQIGGGDAFVINEMTVAQISAKKLA